jgi:hypothetical protein
MQILGDLIRLPSDDEMGLPLPWWHRAPLGLSHNTNVFVGLTASTGHRPVPDLIVTVLNPSRWDRMYRVDCRKEDEPGVVADVLQSVRLNIALAETVKLESGDYHRVTLICEPACENQDVPEEMQHIERGLLEAKFSPFGSNPLYEKLPQMPELAWTRTGFVEHGWITGVRWQQEIQRKYAEGVKYADLSKVVASADTEGRVLRYVFPRKGAMTISIKHADEPNALKEITRVLRECDLNILSSFLRRGGGRGLDAEFVAVCEPNAPSDDVKVQQLRKRLNDAVAEIPQGFRAQVSTSLGRSAEDTIYIRHPQEVVARPPRSLLSAIHDEKRRVRRVAPAQAKTPVFLSHRFTEQTLRSTTLKAIRDALRAKHCFPVEAEASVGRDPVSIYMDVSSKLWNSRAGIIMVTKETDKKNISVNVAHELGFLLGQGKAVLLLVEIDDDCVKAMETFPNMAGVLYKVFRPLDGELRADEEAVDPVRIVSHWIDRLIEDGIVPAHDEIVEPGRPGTISSRVANPRGDGEAVGR